MPYPIRLQGQVVNGRSGAGRTRGLCVPNAALSQLSYAPVLRERKPARFHLLIGMENDEIGRRYDALGRIDEADPLKRITMQSIATERVGIVANKRSPDERMDRAPTRLRLERGPQSRHHDRDTVPQCQLRNHKHRLAGNFHAVRIKMKIPMNRYSATQRRVRPDLGDMLAFHLPMIANRRANSVADC